MISGTFGTAINCIDGRVHEPVVSWLIDRYQLDFVDLVTEAGPDKVLAGGNSVSQEEIKRKVEVSLVNHDSRVIAVSGHDDCAGNPVAYDQHVDQIIKSVDVVKNWGHPLPVLGLWVDESRSVHLIC